MNKRTEELNYKTLECFATIAVEHCKETLSKARMANLLYIAHRQCIKDSNHLLLDDQIIITKYGLAHTVAINYLGLLDMCHINSDVFFEYFRSFGYQIQLVKMPKPKHLSKYSTSLLKEVSRKFIYSDDIDVFDEIRSYPEWNSKKYETNKLDTLSLLKEIVPETADEVYQDLIHSRNLYKLFENIHIIINGKDHFIKKQVLTYEEIVDLSKISVKHPTMTFFQKATNRYGMLCQGGKIEILNGMIFSVADTSSA